MKLRNFMMDTLNVGIKIPTRPLIEGYRERYQSLIKTKQFSHTIYTVMPGNRTMVHIKVPSETIDGFFYDVVFELSHPKEVGNSVLDCDVKFFSNCPSYVYTLQYVMSHYYPDAKGRMNRGDNLAIAGLSRTLGPQPSKDKPVVRNPLGIPMLDKSLYFGIFYMESTLTWDAIKSVHNNITLGQLMVSIPEFDHLMVERKRLENAQKVEKETAKKELEAGFKKHERSIQKPSGIRHALSPKKAVSAFKVGGTTKKPRSPKTTNRK